MRILITGAHGFIGQHVVRELKNHSHTLMFWDRSLTVDEQKALLHKFRPEITIHLAWEGIPDFSPEMCERNVRLSTEIIDFLCNETECKRIIVTGTCQEYGILTGSCTEDAVALGDSTLAAAKVSILVHLRKVCEVTQREWIWLRPFYVYGPGARNASLIPTLLKALHEGVQPSIKNPTQCQDYIHVGDVATAIRFSAEKSIMSGIYNLGSGTLVSVNTILEQLQLIHGDIETSDSSAHDKAGEGFWADLSKTAQALQWHPRISLQEGLIDCFQNAQTMAEDSR